MDVERLNNDFEKRLAAEQSAALKAIREAYEEAIVELSLRAASLTIKGQTFNLSKYPTLHKLVEDVMKDLHSSIYAGVVNSIKASWDLSNEKNNILVDRRLAGRKPNKAAFELLYDPNKSALDAFLKRKEKGLNLSGRVWKTLDNYKTEMEGALGIGISEGQSAAKMASNLKQYLNEPDKLFRRVRNAKGELKLSKRAQEYHPGQGIARSSFSNAKRLTLTETNIAYRSADHERWQKLDFVKGIEVKLSNNHPRYDICDSLVGQYPATYKHVGFHPRCRCYAVPILMNEKEYEKYEDAILDGEELPKVDKIEDIPEGAKEWYKENKERISKWANEPYFLRDNKDFFSEKAKVVEVPKVETPKFTPAKTIKEAEQFLIDKGYAKTADYSIGYTLEQANIVNQTIDDIYQRFKLNQPLGYLETEPMDNAFAVVKDLGLKLGSPPYYVKDATGLNTRLKYLGAKMSDEQKGIIQKTIDSIESGKRDFYQEHSAFAFTDEYEAMVAHEMGHLVRFMYKGLFDDYLKREGFVGWGNTKWKQWAVTNRAMDDIEEMFAETFALYYKGKTKGLHPKLIELFKYLEE